MARSDAAFDARAFGRQVGLRVSAKVVLEALLAAGLLVAFVYGVASGRYVFAAPALVLAGLFVVLVALSEAERIRFDRAEAMRIKRAAELERRRAARGNWDSLMWNIQTRPFHEGRELVAA